MVFDHWQNAPQDTLQPAAVSLSRITVNGTSGLDLPVRANERVRLRLINAAAAHVVSLRLDRHPATVMAIDGQPAEPFRARDNRITLGPGNTADLFVDATLEPGAVARILLADAGGERSLARLVYDTAPPVRRLRSPRRHHCPPTRCRRGSI